VEEKKQQEPCNIEKPEANVEATDIIETEDLEIEAAESEAVEVEAIEPPNAVEAPIEPEILSQESEATEAESEKLADGDEDAVELVEEQIEETDSAESFEEAKEDTAEATEESPGEETVEETVEDTAEKITEETTGLEREMSEEEVEDSAERSLKAPIKPAAVGLLIKPWQLAVAATVVVAMIAGGVVLGVTLGNRSGFNDSPVDYEWVLPEGVQTNENQIVLPGYDKMTFPARKSRVDVVLPNPKENPCYFQYKLILEETGEVLCTTTWIPPGQAVLQIELSRPLPKGEYALIIAIDTISVADGRTPMNGGEQRVLLTVG
jgi:hypothetical protein